MLLNYSTFVLDSNIWLFRDCLILCCINRGCGCCSGIVRPVCRRHEQGKQLTMMLVVLRLGAVPLLHTFRHFTI